MKYSESHSEFSPPGLFKVAKAVGWVTFLDVIRDKILYNGALCSLLLLGVGILASRLAVIQPERVVLDFGLSALMLSCTAVAILIGSSVMSKEFERRTLYVALCHPITRGQFVFGKFCGLALVLLSNWLLVSISYLFLLFFSTPHFSQVFSMALGIAVLFTFVQSLVVGSLAILFSVFSTTSLSVIFSIGLYLVGNNISQIKWVASHSKSPLQQQFMQVVASIFPNFEYFNLGLKTTYGLPVTGDFICLSLLYGLFIMTLSLSLAGVLIQGREV